MLFTLIGDPHAKQDNLDKIRKLFTIAEELGHTTILLGDQLDTKELIRGSCLNTYIECFKKSKLQFIVLVGNHDWFNADCEQHSLEPFKMLPNVIVIDKPTEMVDLNFLPYLKKEDIAQILPKLPKKPLFCHVDIPGFDYGNGHISEVGVDSKAFARFPIVVSGHYHKHQKSGNIVYLGTPFSHSFGESNQKKFIGIFDSKTNKIEYLETDFPKHITYEVNVDTGQYKAEDYTLGVDKVRIVLKGTQERINQTVKIEGVKYVEIPIQNLVKSNSFNELSSPQDQWTKWCKQRKLSEEAKAAGLEILNSVR